MFSTLGVAGLTARARSLAATVLQLCGTRVALAAAEFDEFVVTRTLGAACVAGAVVCALIADVLVCGAVLWSLPNAWRGKALLGLALVNAAMAVGLLVAARRIVRATPAFAASVDELHRDACALEGAKPVQAGAATSGLGTRTEDPLKPAAPPAGPAH